MPEHNELFKLLHVLPSDYSDYGGTVVRWEREDVSYPDCSCGCKWALWLEAPFQYDWCVCAKPGAPRAGLLTFEHMTGRNCFEEEADTE
jgi:hypothetical protein